MIAAAVFSSATHRMRVAQCGIRHERQRLVKLCQGWRAPRCGIGRPISIPPVLLEWSKGFASLSPGAPPCPGLRHDEWADTHRRCGEFIERWGMQAHAAGWDTLRLFGASPELDALRGDFCGVLIPSSRWCPGVMLCAKGLLG